MEITGTKQAFLAMLSERGIYKKLKVDRSTVAGWKSRGCTVDKMEEMLLKAGSTVVSEKVWVLHKISKTKYEK